MLKQIGNSGEDIMENGFIRELDKELVKNILSIAFTLGCCLIDSKKWVLAPKIGGNWSN